MKLFFVFFFATNIYTSTLNRVQDIDYMEVNGVFAEIKMLFAVDSISLVRTPLQEWAYVKKIHEKEFLDLFPSQDLKGKVAKFIEYNSREFEIWDSSKLVKCKLVSSPSFNPEYKMTLNRRKDHKKMASFPVFALTVPYFIDKHYCIVGISYYSGYESGSYGYYLFRKIESKWKLDKKIFGLLK